MKIDMHLFGRDRTAGVQVLMRMVGGLQAAGHEVGVTSLGRASTRRFIDPPPGVEVRHAGFRGRPHRALVRLAPGLVRFPQREIRALTVAAPSGVDLRIATYNYTVKSCLAAGDAPVLHHVQHFEVLFERSRRLQELMKDCLVLPAYRTANSTWVANRLSEIGVEVAGLVLNAVDHEVFFPQRAEQQPGPFRVITLGKAVDWKGMTDVVEGTRRFAQGFRGPVELLTYGRNRPRVPAGLLQHHAGPVSHVELARLYNAADVCVSGSWYESFPLPPLEAMACGIPVICTRLGTEDYAVHEDNALIVRPREPDDIAVALTRLANDADLRTMLVQRGLDTAARFQWATSEQQFVDHAERAARA